MISPEQQELRWQQRFANYQRALRHLVNAVNLSRERELSLLEQQGLIKAFELTQELAWKVMKDFFEYQGNVSILGSRDAIREAFRLGLVEDGEGWMETIVSRNRSTHTYDEAAATALTTQIADHYLSLFSAFEKRMQGLIQ